MPRLDAYHQVVKQSLINDGWTITHDPLTIKYKRLRWYTDLGAEKTFAAAKGSQKIAVEVKVFGGSSFADDLEKATGQYVIYRGLLKRTEPERELFLAVERKVWEDFFQRAAIRDIIEDQQLRLLIFDAETEEVVEWTK